MEIRKKLKVYQSEFMITEARYPALVSAWATGKTMCGVGKVLDFCERFKDNLFCIFRKEYTDLRDSTCKDWERLTGLKIDSGRDCKLPSGSLVMFRHLEEMNNLSNINLGGFWIEQAEELDSDEQFHYLRGRLRREGCEHTGFITANTKGHNWIYRLWKAQQQKNYALWEATTWDNESNLPSSYTEDLRQLKTEKPKIYNRFVENSWDDVDTVENCISPSHIQKAKERSLVSEPPIRRIIGVDVARKGNDKTVFYALENGIVLGRQELEKKDTMETVGYLLMFAEKHKNIKNFAIDELNAGAGVVDRLNELKNNGSKSIKKVVPVSSASASRNPEKYRNIRAEIYGYGAEQFELGKVKLDKTDSDLCEQLRWSNWKAIDSNKVLQVELKEDIIARYGRSPDNADAYLYGLWGMQFVEPVVFDRESQNRNGWSNGCYVPERWKSRDRELEPSYY